VIAQLLDLLDICVDRDCFIACTSTISITV